MENDGSPIHVSGCDDEVNNKVPIFQEYELILNDGKKQELGHMRL